MREGGRQAGREAGWQGGRASWGQRERPQRTRCRQEDDIRRCVLSSKCPKHSSVVMGVAKSTVKVLCAKEMMFIASGRGTKLCAWVRG